MYIADVFSFHAQNDSSGRIFRQMHSEGDVVKNCCCIHIMHLPENPLMSIMAKHASMGKR